ncbi:MAG: ankyrin repeat domain-containing protein 7-like isoform X2 [Faunusvirus sp.]|jgi:hypothetical protein|uniref:Ankyrin repeat domain-containing protein 7-like isoform X2 n=1 Tax=Faunusvirus sp. TaxID=2487766 RepID=A0A3G5A0T5_9VIRU|nr:MAG: ankyrin repeat domain-containing protein 7-like isoform X2 [Faunusvirus sp.]
MDSKDLTAKEHAEVFLQLFEMDETLCLQYINTHTDFYDVVMEGDDGNQSTVFLQTCFDMKENLILEMIKNGANIHALDKYNYGAMDSLCFRGHKQAAEKLIEMKYNLNQKNGCNTTPLITAIYCDENDCALLLIKNGIDVNITNHMNETALQVACDKTIKNETIAIELIRHGAEFINIIDTHIAYNELDKLSAFIREIYNKQLSDVVAIKDANSAVDKCFGQFEMKHFVKLFCEYII